MIKCVLFAVGFVGAVLLLFQSPCWAATNLVFGGRNIPWLPGISTDLSNQLYQAAPSGRAVPAFIKFTNALTTTNYQLLQDSGVRLQGYLRDDAYAALLPSQSFLTNTAVQSLIFSGQHWLASDRFRIATSTNQLPNWAYDPQSNAVSLLVACWPSVAADTVTNDLASLGLSGVLYGADNSWAVVVPLQTFTNWSETLTNIGSLLSVRSIWPGPLPFMPLLSESRRCAKTHDAQGFVFTPGSLGLSNPKYNKVSGEAVRIAICDGLFREDHNDFKRIGQSNARFRFYTLPVTALPLDPLHATTVASVALGDGFASQSLSPQFRNRGHAPHAHVGNYLATLGAWAPFFQVLNTDKSHVSNHSYVQSLLGYDPTGASLDQIVRGTDKATGLPVPPRPQVWGAGNNGVAPEYGTETGYFSVFTSAKNTISVGSVDTDYDPPQLTDPPRLSRYSSLGPLPDQRIKPDIVAPGSHISWKTGTQIMAASSAGANAYAPVQGTSYAAPVVSGIIALMMHQYKQTFGIPPNLHPATYKALLIQTATDLIKTVKWPPDAWGGETDWDNPDTLQHVIYHAGPDYATGYGLVNAEAARQRIATSSQWGQGVINKTGGAQTWCIEVSDSSRDLQVVVAWDDEPDYTPPSETDPKLVNDLDLILTAPDGTVHFPWTLPPLPVTGMKPTDVLPAIQTTPDHINNVEMVTVKTPSAGTWTATVTGYILPNNNLQPYGLVSSHSASQLCLSPQALEVLKRYFEAIPIDICRLYPPICEPHYVCVPRLRPVPYRKYYFLLLPFSYWKDPGRLSDPIFFPWLCPVPISEICNYVLNCPNCDHGSALQLCAGFQMTVAGLPTGATIVIFNDRGEILDYKTRVDNRTRPVRLRTLNVPPQPAGNRLFVMVLPQQPLELPREDMRLKFGFQ